MEKGLRLRSAGTVYNTAVNGMSYELKDVLLQVLSTYPCSDVENPSSAEDRGS